MAGKLAAAGALEVFPRKRLLLAPVRGDIPPPLAAAGAFLDELDIKGPRINAFAPSNHRPDR